jgi:hypothetical protein
LNETKIRKEAAMTHRECKLKITLYDFDFLNEIAIFNVAKKLVEFYCESQFVG